jgi:hypothetical protein
MFEETATMLAISGINFIGIAALYYRLGKVESKFKQLPCYSNKEFAAIRRKVCK